MLHACAADAANLARPARHRARLFRPRRRRVGRASTPRSIAGRAQDDAAPTSIENRAPRRGGAGAGRDAGHAWPRSTAPMSVTCDRAWDIAAPGPKATPWSTATPGLALGILTADCAPVLFADARGRRDRRRPCRLERRARRRAGSDRRRDGSSWARGASDIAAAIGPCISQANYEVGREFRDRFLARGSRQRALLRRRATAPAITASICPAMSRTRLDARRRRRRRTALGLHLCRAKPIFSASAAPPIAARRIMGGRSRQLCCEPEKRGLPHRTALAKSPSSNRHRRGARFMSRSERIAGHEAARGQFQPRAGRGHRPVSEAAASPRRWCAASPTWKCSSRSRRMSAARTCSSSSRPAFPPTTI